jgi:hypothetical protein
VQITGWKDAPRVRARVGLPSSLLALLTSLLALVVLGAPGIVTAAAAQGLPGAPAPQLTASPTSVNFGSLPLGDVSAATAITLKNTGTATDNISSFDMGGADPDDFTYDSNCGQVLTQSSCTLNVSFLPGALGARKATITPVDGSKMPPVIALSGTGTEGYLETTTEGIVRGFGDAQVFGDTSGMTLKAPIVTIATTGDNGGYYWEVASDGGIFSFGDAQFYGSTGGIALNRPVVGMAETLDGGGYWLVASDGGIFAFGDAQFYGSTGSIALNKPIVGMAVTPDGGGYWLVASDGGIFAFGDAPYYGSLNGAAPSPTVAMAESGYYTFQAASDQPADRAQAQAQLRADTARSHAARAT